jgi:hypothetical protein
MCTKPLARAHYVHLHPQTGSGASGPRLRCGSSDDEAHRLAHRLRNVDRARVVAEGTHDLLGAPRSALSAQPDLALIASRLRLLAALTAASARVAAQAFRSSW